MSQKFFEIGQDASKKFIDSLKNDVHLLLLYEDLRKAENIQIDFLKQGLLNGECCIFAMPYKTNIEEKMMKKGIDVLKYKKNNLLHIFPIVPQSKNSDAVKDFKKFSEKIQSITKDKVRICAMLNIDLSTKEGMEAFILAETTSHENFNSFSGSWLCSYNIAEINKEEKISWIKKLIKQHHSVIIAPLNESGIVFDVD